MPFVSPARRFQNREIVLLVLSLYDAQTSVCVCERERERERVSVCVFGVLGWGAARVEFKEECLGVYSFVWMRCQ